MKKIMTLMAALLSLFAVSAGTYKYRFDSVPLSEALTRIAEDHKNLHINFIYNELGDYKSTATLNTDNAYDALRQTIGLNPVSVVSKNGRFYVEAMQHGRFRFSGHVAGTDNEPVAAATVMLLSRRDSTVVTYGITDGNGYFSIPCDRNRVVAKITAMGYKTRYHTFDKFNVGRIVMEVNPIMLSDVKIEAQNTQLATDKNTYIPSSRQKKSSQNAVDLLRRMAIPQLVLIPGANSVQDLFGNPVSIYINGCKADDSDLQGMRMSDVRKVEFIENPSDARFQGENHVINFIVQEYAYGGYTKISTAETMLNGFSNDLSVFSKFTLKNITYDLFAGSVNSNHHHTGTDTKSGYIFADGDNMENIYRSEICTESHKKADEYPISFRMSHNTDRFKTKNSIYFTHNTTQHNDMSGSLDISNHRDNNYEYQRLSPSMYNTVYYHGDFQGTIGESVYVHITPSFNYIHRSNRSDYSSTVSDPINNMATEDVYSWGIQSSASKSIGRKHNISLNFTVSQTIDRLRYSRSDNEFNSLSNLGFYSMARYMLRTSVYRLGASAGIAYERTSTNGTLNNDVYPYVWLNGSMALNKKNQLSASVYYQTTTPSISLRSNDIVQSNELMYMTGNPDLHNVRNLDLNLAYNFVHSNALSVSFFTGYKEDFDKVTTIYRPFKEGTALLRDFVNEGDYMRFFFGAAVNCKLFDNSLQLYANINQNFYHTSGIYIMDLRPIKIQLQATYYWKSFSAQAYWVNRDEKLTENSNIVIRGRDSYGLSMGWGNGAWNVNLSARNIFRRGWRSSTWTRDTPFYNEIQTYYNPSVHANLNLSLTYTIGYGKKIRRGDEIRGESDNGPSAILK